MQAFKIGEVSAINMSSGLLILQFSALSGIICDVYSFVVCIAMTVTGSILVIISRI